METVIQTRLTEHLAKSLKMDALHQGVSSKKCISTIFQQFMAEKPWTCGTWVKQPKTTSDFKPIAVKIPTDQALAFEKMAEQMEVSTSSLAYTSLDWYFNKPKIITSTQKSGTSS